jgi:hypothetical protein
MLSVMDDGVEKIPVPMIRPMLEGLISCQYVACARKRDRQYVHEKCRGEDPQMAPETSRGVLVRSQLTRLSGVSLCEIVDGGIAVCR